MEHEKRELSPKQLEELLRVLKARFEKNANYIFNFNGYDRLLGIVEMVANAHGHFEHTGGNGWFSHAYMHEKALLTAKTPYPSLDASQYKKIIM